MTDADKPSVLLSTFEAVRIAQGRAMTCRTTEGHEIVVRLATPEEAMAQHIDATARLVADGMVDLEPNMTMTQAVELTKPLPS